MANYLILTVLLSILQFTAINASLACITNPCVYGICVEAANSLIAGSQGYTCYCIDGYTGGNCQTNWDECWSAPCLNGGSCSDGIAYFNCTCPEGFVGNTCEENINECGSNPCLNNGTCVDINNGYMCACSPGYSGYNCEMDMAVCNTTEETRCTNGGVCIEGPGVSFLCRCLPGWTGRLCEVPVDECSSSPCENGGVCIDMHATYICACPYGYTGVNCETQVELCSTNPCENGALCVVEGRTSVCYCVPDYHGDRCQFRYDECQKGPGCLNGATCIDGVDSYTCSCATDFTGRFCECQIGTGGILDCNYFYTIMPTVTETPRTTGPITQSNATMSSLKPTQTTGVFFSSNYTTWMSDVTTVDSQTHFLQTDSTEASLLPTTDVGHHSIQTNTFSTSELYEYTSIHETGQTITSETSMSSTNTDFSILFPLADTSSTTSLSTEIPMPTFESDSSSPAEVASVSSQFSSTDTPSWELTTPSITTFSEVSTNNVTHLVKDQSSSLSTYITPTYMVDWMSTTQKMLFRSSTEGTPFSTDLDLNCFQVPCLNSGTCMNTTQGSKCFCNFGWKGKFCEEEEGIKVAAFQGRSYLLHVFNNDERINVALNMKTLADTGVILYAHLSTSVFMALYLQQGFLKFQFSCGMQNMLFSELKHSINTGYEMHISASLNLQAEKGLFHNCNGSVRLNGTLSMSGKQQAYFPPFGQKLSGALYLGGLSKQLYAQADLPVRKGVTACMHSLIVNNHPQDIYREALDGMDITECESLACLSSPCLNSATCIDFGQNWSCLCSAGYLGKTCQRSVCSNNPCKFGGTCVQYPGSGFLCLCPLGKHGMYCDQDLEVGHPLFSSSVSGLSSYIAYPLPGAIHHSFELHFRFMPSSMDQIALMVFIGQGHPHDSTSDHLAISFIKGYVVLTWNLGSGPRRIFTPQSILHSGKSKDVHIARVGRLGQKGWLQVDAMPNVTGSSPGWLTQLNTRPIIYLGGHESQNFSGLPHDLPLHTGFSGCIYDVELRAGRMRLQIQRSKDAVGRNVGQCNTKHCHNSTCLNRGACIDHGATYTCLCQDGWYSPGCAVRYNPCDSMRHNCSEGSTCVPLSLGYECDCPLGKSGQFCEKDETLSDVGFSGKRSYLSLPPAALDLTETCIDLEIRPTRTHGLIFFSTQSQGPTTSFISLSLHGGVIELRLRPAGPSRNGEVLVIRSAQVVALSQWTRIRAGRYGRRIYLWIDGIANSGFLLPGDIMLPSHTPLFLGGTEDLSNLPPGAVAGLPLPFTGCIRRLWLNWRSLPLDSQFVISARNINDCDGTACGGDVCVNGGSCWISPDNRPICTCPEQYSGDRCENVVSCKLVGCEHKGRCVTQGKTKSCTCPIGWTGKFCEQEVGHGAPHFGGNSYLVVDSKRAKREDSEDQWAPKSNTLYSKQGETGISYLFVNFSTAQPDGLLLWTSKSNDFLGIGVETGMLKLAWGKIETGKNELVLPGTSVADGSWHTLTISYHNRAINFWADKLAPHMVFSNTSLLSDGIFYIGGFPDGRLVVEETSGSFHSPFTGCVQEIVFNDLNFISDFFKYNGENLNSCDQMHP